MNPPDEPTTTPPGGDEASVPGTGPTGAAPPVSPRAERQADLEAGGAKPGGSPPKPSPATGLFLYVLVVALFIMFAPLVAPLKLGGVVLLQIGCILGASLWYAQWLEQPIREMLGLCLPSLRALVGASLLGSSAWLFLVVVLIPIQTWILPVPDQFLEQREALLAMPEGVVGRLLLWAAAALTPAICEEVLFRGVLLPSFRTRLADGRAIVLVSILFAVFHFNPYQLSITFLMGCMLGWLRIRTGSLFSCIAFHLLNNLLVLEMSRVEDEVMLGYVVAPLAVLLIIGFWLIHRSPRPVPADGHVPGGEP